MKISTPIRFVAISLLAGSVISFAPTAFAQAKTKKPTAAQKTKISADQAKKIALSKFKGEVKKAPVLEKEDGVWQWEVIVTSGAKMTEVNVDATTGKINSSESVTAKEETNEKKPAQKKG